MTFIEINIIFDLLKYSFIILFGCLAFVAWYFHFNADRSYKELTKEIIWIEVLFLYRDYTKAKFGRVHFVYHIALICISFIVTTLVLLILPELLKLVSPLNYLVLFIALMTIGPLAIALYNMSKNSYYKENKNI